MKVFLLVTALAAGSITIITHALLGAVQYGTSASGAPTDPLAADIGKLATGKSGAAIEQQRQDMILETADAGTFKMVSTPRLAQQPSTSSGVQYVYFPPPNPGTAESIAYSLLPSFGFSQSSQWGCLYNLWQRESGWRYNAQNSVSGAYGIPQALPGSKMASAGPDWLTDPKTQIIWGLGYIKNLYGTPCGAWAHETSYGWY